MKALLVAMAMAAAACGPSMQLTSPDLTDGAPMARTYYYTRCGGQNVAPALAWSGGPSNVGTYAITVIDLSVQPRDWSHWIVVNIPPNVHELPRGGALPAGASQVESNFGDSAYDGPCPPEGTGVHRYEFTVYALPGRAPSILANGNAAQIRDRLSSLALAKGSIVVTAEH